MSQETTIPALTDQNISSTTQGNAPTQDQLRSQNQKAFRINTPEYHYLLIHEAVGQNGLVANFLRDAIVEKLQKEFPNKTIPPIPGRKKPI